MQRVPLVIGLLALTATILVGTGYTQDKKPDDKKGDPPPKVQLPANFAKLGLSADQKKKVYAIRGDYHTKIEDLKNQIEKLKKDDYAECYKILTDDQKATLKKIIGEKGDPGVDDKKGDGKKEDKK
jgi:hypothetical protein